MSEQTVNSTNIKISIIANPAGNIGRLTLHKPEALNALDLDMVKCMLAQLEAWRTDRSIAAVFIDSEHDKAFCAGGDIVSMYKAMASEATGNLPDFIAQFFEQEYRLDYCIHTFNKPIIAWGHGIIMGGGLGVFAAASIKIATEKARVAMPEITIGLFPDVGASYFLNNMPAGVGRFLGLTAASINASDCVAVGLADYILYNDIKSTFIQALTTIDDLSETGLTQLCQRSVEAEKRAPDVGNLNGWYKQLAVFANIELGEVAATLHKLHEQDPSDRFMQKAKNSFESGSPITAHLVYEQLQRAQSKTLAECFQMELSMAYTCACIGEFQEGVRALLIDKDQQPKWQYTNVELVDYAVVNAHFTRFANSQNPLTGLVQDYGDHSVNKAVLANALQQ
ncbi:MAG: enoyl-CoA hydratase/isomerase family protein [Glaciecola sp.]